MYSFSNKNKTDRLINHDVFFHYSNQLKLHIKNFRHENCFDELNEFNVRNFLYEHSFE